jgi:hypothetical protein
VGGEGEEVIRIRISMNKQQNDLTKNTKGQTTKKEKNIHLKLKIE